MAELGALPGGDLVERGLADLREGRHTPLALLVASASRRLCALGVPGATPIPDAELRLYRALCDEDPTTAFARYQSLRRRLVSFTRAVEQEQASARRARPD